MLLVAIAAGAADEPADSAEVIFDRPAATVNGEIITVRMVRQQIERLAPGADAESAELFRQVLGTLINRRLLVQAAEREFSEAAQAHLETLAQKRAEGGWDPERIEPADEETTQAIYEDYLIQAYLDRKVYQPVQVSPGEVKAYYEDNIESFALPGTLRVRQILIREGGRSSDEAKALVEAAAARIAEGEAFEDVAREVSEGPYAESGGLWPAKRPGELIKPVAEAVKKLEPPALTDPFHSPLGWHLVRLEQRTPGRAAPFGDVQQRIHEVLANARRSAAREKLMARLRASAVIRILLDTQREPSGGEAPQPGKS